PAAVTAIVACALGLRLALAGHWDTYGALQLPLVFETAAATAIAATAASPLGERERLTGRWLPYLRLAATLALAAVAAGVLGAARRRRGGLRRAGIRHRGRGHHGARGPRSGRRGSLISGRQRRAGSDGLRSCGAVRVTMTTPAAITMKDTTATAISAGLLVKR